MNPILAEVLPNCRNSSAARIPAVTLGLTLGEKNLENEPDYVLIEPILTGLAQLLGVVLEIDRGACDEP